MARRSAQERRELVIEAARQEFAAFGLYGATGEAISYRAGISHPYLLRLFGSKRQLFLVVVERSFDELLAALRATEDEAPDRTSLPMLIASARSSLASDEGFLAHLQFYAACGDDEVRLVVRRRFAELYQFLERASGAPPDEIRVALGELTLEAVAAAVRLPELAGREDWARRVVGKAR